MHDSGLDTARVLLPPVARESCQPSLAHNVYQSLQYSQILWSQIFSTGVPLTGSYNSNHHLLSYISRTEDDEDDEYEILTSL